MMGPFDAQAEHKPPRKPDNDRKIDAVRRIIEQIGALDADQAESVAHVVEKMIGGAR